MLAAPVVDQQSYYDDCDSSGEGDQSGDCGEYGLVIYCAEYKSKTDGRDQQQEEDCIHKTTIAAAAAHIVLIIHGLTSLFLLPVYTMPRRNNVRRPKSRTALIFIFRIFR